MYIVTIIFGDNVAYSKTAHYRTKCNINTPVSQSQQYADSAVPVSQTLRRLSRGRSVNVTLICKSLLSRDKTAD